jgi:hypothetical protein
VSAALLGGACADARGDREKAVAHYAEAAALMEEVPDQSFYDYTREIAAEGRRRTLAPEEVRLSWWVTHVPR